MPSAMDIRVRTGGVEYVDIESATMTRSIDQLADVVSIQFSDKWMTRGSDRSLPFTQLDAAEFVIDGEAVVSGYISALPRKWEAGRTFTMRLTSAAGNLVLSSYVAKPRRWKDKDVKRVVSDICKPYGINVTTILADVGEPFKSFAVRPGEKAAAVILRALEARGLWLMSRPGGHMELVEAGQARYVLPFIGPGHTLPSNVIGFATDGDSDMLASEYIVSGSSNRIPNLSADKASGFAIATDPSVEIYRPMLLTVGGRSKHLGYQAQREMATRAARAREFSIAVEGAYWDHGAVPELLEPNRRAQIELPDDDIAGEFLITTVSTKMGDGTLTSLICTPPEAYMRKSPPPKPKRRSPRKTGKAASWT